MLWFYLLNGFPLILCFRVWILKRKKSLICSAIDLFKFNKTKTNIAVISWGRTLQSYAACHMSHMTCHMSDVTCYKWHVSLRMTSPRRKDTPAQGSCVKRAGFQVNTPFLKTLPDGCHFHDNSILRTTRGQAILTCGAALECCFPIKYGLASA